MTRQETALLDEVIERSLTAYVDLLTPAAMRLIRDVLRRALSDDPHARALVERLSAARSRRLTS